MAGTNRRRQALSGGPAIILVEPQLGENIGTAARAMFNCGLTDLRLVAPRDGWPNDKAVAAASGADTVLDRARLYGRVEDAIADLHHVYVTTARDRYMVKRVLTPRAAAAEMRAAMVGRAMPAASCSGRSGRASSTTRSRWATASFACRSTPPFPRSILAQAVSADRL